MGWTGGYVLLALLLAPYLRKFGKFTVPDFVGDRYYSQTARARGGDLPDLRLVHLRHRPDARRRRRLLPLPRGGLSTSASDVGMGIVFVYAVLGGMKGITYTQVAQYCVLIFAYIVPAIFISLQLTGHALPQLGLAARRPTAAAACPCSTSSTRLSADLGFAAYTAQKDSDAEPVPAHPVADDRHRRPAARHHPLLHRARGCATRAPRPAGRWSSSPSSTPRRRRSAPWPVST